MKFKDFDFKGNVEDLEDGKWRLYGWASTPTVDKVKDKVHYGAFTKSIEAFHNQPVSEGRLSQIKFLWQHDKKVPIGYPVKIEEVEGKGLYIEAVFFQDEDFPEARKAYKLAKMGIVDRLSIGYNEVKTAPRTKDKPWNDLIEVDWREFSLVTIPANDECEVVMVKEEAVVEEVIAEEVPVVEEVKEYQLLDVKSFREEMTNIFREVAREIVTEMLTGQVAELVDTEEEEEKTVSEEVIEIAVAEEAAEEVPVVVEELVGAPKEDDLSFEKGILSALLEIKQHISEKE